MPFAKIPFELTSKAHAQSADGNYPFNIEALLVPHEALRREMRRARKALENFDVSVHPWKAHYMKEWLDGFLLPVVHEHHDMEELVVSPELVKLGVVIPPHINGSHAGILALMDRIQSTCTELWNIVAINAHADQHAQLKLNEFRDLFIEFHDTMSDHLAQEEEFFSSEIAKIDRKDWAKIEVIIQATVKKHKSGELFLMSIFDSMGFYWKGYPHVEGDTRWLSEEQATATLVGTVPYPVRAIIFAGFNKKYQRFKVMINAVNGTEDVLKLGQAQTGCSCVIA